MQLCSAVPYTITIFLPALLALLILNTTANHTVTNNKLAQQQHKLKTSDCKIYLISDSNTIRKIDNDFTKIEAYQKFPTTWHTKEIMMSYGYYRIQTNNQ